MDQLFEQVCKKCIEQGIPEGMAVCKFAVMLTECYRQHNNTLAFNQFYNTIQITAPHVPQPPQQPQASPTRQPRQLQQHVDSDGNHGTCNLWISLPLPVVDQVREEMKRCFPFRKSDSYNMILDKFESFGGIVRTLKFPRTNNPHGHCYVTMETTKDAIRIMDCLDGARWKNGFFKIRYNKWLK